MMTVKMFRENLDKLIESGEITEETQLVMYGGRLSRWPVSTLRTEGMLLALIMEADPL